ncbi:malonyl-CoA-acyl carrier protein transacylase, mitochondrial isoform X1 [Phycodurus eques]|uniref:malonyl-CoA-acyl carrier protein transacylase, mitochondrial isoform X1 n=1 Tax=Phycodurus eques TaxID=693459 RepID=UPI002ACE0499|nr:malonyl-CoA-acyl carrier protein transacylase, mitochondrial isoform X1 [Phycodurus eques]
MSTSLVTASVRKVRPRFSWFRALSTNQPENGSPSPAETPAEPRPWKDPGGRSVLLFPGQGSQFVGMGRGLLRYPNVGEMFEAARKILGYDLLSLCLNGPEEDLVRTVHCQPAVFVTSLAAVEKLNHQNPKAIETCVAAAGFSVGEFAALVFAGAMSFAEGKRAPGVGRPTLPDSFSLALYAVKVRAEAMQRASELAPGGMLSVVGKAQAQYKHACLLAREHCRASGVDEPVCAVATYLFPDGRVIAGHRQALDFLQHNASRFHFLRTRMLPVGGAFHTELMNAAVEPLREVLRQLEVRRPEISVYSNVDGKRYMSEGHVRRQLTRQLTAPVKWEQTLHEIFERARGERFPCAYEVGPSRHLGATLQRCNRKAFDGYVHVHPTADDEP